MFGRRDLGAQVARPDMRACLRLPLVMAVELGAVVRPGWLDGWMDGQRLDSSCACGLALVVEILMVLFTSPLELWGVMRSSIVGSRLARAHGGRAGSNEFAN